MKIELRQIARDLGDVPEMRPPVPPAEYESRMVELYSRAGVDWVVVYADREHSGNTTFLCNYDPRFEEGLLLLGPKGIRYLVIGVEGLSYVDIVPVDIECLQCDSLSLPGIPRTTPRLEDVLKDAGIGPGMSVGVVGWKYLEPEETDDTTEPSFVPVWLVNVLRSLVGKDGTVTDSTQLMIHPETGMRANNSAAQIAAFEWAGRFASTSVFRAVRGTRPGMTERKAFSQVNYSGEPIPFFPTFITTSSYFVNGLRSPSAKKIEYGDAIVMGYGTWGSLCARGGLVQGHVDESYLATLVEPYYRAMATWYQTLRVGISGGEVYSTIEQVFEGMAIHSTLNPGHLISIEEWLNTPIRPDSDYKLRSGMAFQADMIPGPLPESQMILCEDTVVLADGVLRDEIKAGYPEMWGRIEERRTFLKNELGVQINDDLLPLSNAAAYLPPFWLLDDLVCVVSS